MIERAERHFQKTDPHLHAHLGFKQLRRWLMRQEWWKTAGFDGDFASTVVDGLLETIWRWAYVHASGGDVTKMTGDDLVSLTGWPGDGDALLGALVKAGFVIENDGSRELAKWGEWGGALFTEQRRAADAERQRRKYARDHAEEPVEPDSPPEPHATSRPVTKPHDKKENKNKKKEHCESDDSHLPVESVDNSFDQAWKHYPRKTDREPARQQFTRRLKEGHKPGELISAAEHYGKACKGKEPQYIKHGKTFFGPSKPFLDWVIGIPACEAGPQEPPKQVDDTIRCGGCRRVIGPADLIDEHLVVYGRGGWWHRACAGNAPTGDGSPQEIGGVLRSALDSIKPKEGA